jgi:hypothetical protein
LKTEVPKCLKATFAACSRSLNSAKSANIQSSGPLFNSFQHGELLKPLLHQRFLEMLQHLCIFQPPRPTSGILLRLCREGRNRRVVTRFDSSDGTRRLGRLRDNRSYYASVSYGNGGKHTQKPIFMAATSKQMISKRHGSSILTKPSLSKSFYSSGMR